MVKKLVGGEASNDLFDKLTLLLVVGIPMSLIRSLLIVKYSADSHNTKENIRSAVQKLCINCLHKIFENLNVQEAEESSQVESSLIIISSSVEADESSQRLKKVHKYGQAYNHFCFCRG